MKQSSLRLNRRITTIDDNVLHVAFNKFSPQCRPSNLEVALRDPTFSKILHARASQLIKQLKQNQLLRDEVIHE